LAAAFGSKSPETNAAKASLQAAEPSAPRQPSVSVDAMKLWQDYDSNEVAADNIYKGKTLRVSGTVDSIDKDAFDNMVLGLHSPNPFMHTRAKMVAADAPAVASLAKGARVVLVCEARGRIIGSPVLDDCSFDR
jgi:hypothetical protein